MPEQDDKRSSQRSEEPREGAFRFDSSTGRSEMWNGSEWVSQQGPGSVQDGTIIHRVVGSDGNEVSPEHVGLASVHSLAVQEEASPEEEPARSRESEQSEAKTSQSKRD